MAVVPLVAVVGVGFANAAASWPWHLHYIVDDVTADVAVQ